MGAQAAPQAGPEPRQTELHQAMPIDAKEFITSAGDSGKAEVTIATMAETRASSDRVKDFAAMLVKDHSAANKELTGIASKKNVTIGAISPSKKEVVDRLTRTDRAGFDKAFMTQMVEDHKKSVDLYTRGTASPDADIKAFASRTLPTIKQHLTEAEDVLKELGPSTATERPAPAPNRGQ
jgi:putative membrane protein